MLARRTAYVLGLTLALTGCAETATCPVDRPVRRDGMCVAAGDAGMDGGEEDAQVEPDAFMEDAAPDCAEDCEATGRFCDYARMPPVCVACSATSNECPATDPSCSADGECTPCASQADCARFTATPVCDTRAGSVTEGQCIVCDEASEADLCGSNWCNPVTGACTDTPRGTASACTRCAADAECARGSHCVAMEFPLGTTRPNRYCLPAGDEATCERPYDYPVMRASTAGASVEVCTLGEHVTTCEAMRAFISDRSCPGGTDGECAADGAVCAAGDCRARCMIDRDCPMSPSIPNCDTSASPPRCR